MHLPENVDHVLMSFEGAVCTAIPKATMAASLRLLLGDAKLPRRVANTADPIVVLRHGATFGVATATTMHRQLRALEHEAVLAAGVADGAREVLSTLRATGTVVTVVSSLAPEAIHGFLVINDLQELVRQIAARGTPDPDPHLVELAVHRRGIPKDACVFVGTARQDRKAARAAGIRVVSSLVNPQPRLPWGQDLWTTS